MTHEGRVEDFWTTKRRNSPDEDNVRPLLKALAAARRSLNEDHPAEPTTVKPDAVVVDIRPGSRWDSPAIEFLPEEPDATGVARAANAAVAAESVAAAAQAAAAASAAVARAIAARNIPADWITVEPEEPEAIPTAPATEAVPETEARSKTEARAAAEAAFAAEHPAPEWGDLWRESVQGWVREADGTKVWRPIVTTTTSVPNWEIDTNLGMVTGESACSLDAVRLGHLLASPGGAESLRRELALDRGTAQEAMVREAVARGAHAVIGVNLDYTPLGDCLIVTATGTAVTLRVSG